MGRRSDIQFVALTCPACGSNLPALEEDVAFTCRLCARAYELHGDHLAPVPLLVIPHPAEHAGFYLPFWQLAAGVRIPAFNTREVLSLARGLSGLELSEREGAVKNLVGGTLSSAEARALADFAGLTAGEGPGSAALLAMPFLDEGSRLLDAVTGRVLYKETIDRAEALVRAAQPSDGVA